MNIKVYNNVIYIGIKCVIVIFARFNASVVVVKNPEGIR